MWSVNQPLLPRADTGTHTSLVSSWRKIVTLLPCSQGRHTQAWSTCGVKLRLAATSVVDPGNGDLK